MRLDISVIRDLKLKYTVEVDCQLNIPDGVYDRDEIWDLIITKSKAVAPEGTVSFHGYKFDSPPVDKWSYKEPPEEAWIDVDGELWALSPGFAINKSCPVQIPPTIQWWCDFPHYNARVIRDMASPSDMQTNRHFDESVVSDLMQCDGVTAFDRGNVTGFYYDGRLVLVVFCDYYKHHQRLARIKNHKLYMQRVP